MMIRTALKLICERHDNWSVVGEASDCRGALLLIESEQPDVLLLDLTLTDGSALDCLPLMRKISRALIVVITGIDDPAVHQQALERGADDVVLKGEEPEVLFAAVTKGLQHMSRSLAPV